MSDKLTSAEEWAGRLSSAHSENVELFRQAQRQVVGKCDNILRDCLRGSTLAMMLGELSKLRAEIDGKAEPKRSLTEEQVQTIESTLSRCGWNITANVFGGGHEWEHAESPLYRVRVTPDGVTATTLTPTDTPKANPQPKRCRHCGKEIVKKNVLGKYVWRHALTDSIYCVVVAEPED